jgi:hypothetical protein
MTSVGGRLEAGARAGGGFRLAVNLPAPLQTGNEVTE